MVYFGAEGTVLIKDAVYPSWTKDFTSKVKKCGFNDFHNIRFSILSLVAA